jgi:hypothetical protein
VGCACGLGKCYIGNLHKNIFGRMNFPLWIFGDYKNFQEKKFLIFFFIKFKKVAKLS